MSSKVSVKITRNYGPFSVEWGLDSDGHEFTNQGQVTAEYERLYKALEIQIELFESSRLNAWGSKWASGKMTADERNPQTAPGNADGVGVWYDVSGILIKVEGNKKLYRVKTHQENFAKWGVAVYDEVVKEYRLDEFMAGDFEKPVYAGRVYVVTTNGKSKAVKFEGLF